MKRSRFVLIVLFAMLGAACAEPHSPRTLIMPAESLQADAKNLAAPRKFFAVVITQHDCEYCALLRKSVLHPAIRSDELDPRIELREVSTDSGFSLTDFQGQIVSGKEFANRYGIDITPTVLFLDKAGESLVEPLVGTGNIEFYSFYLDQKIEAAEKALSAPRQLPH